MLTTAPAKPVGLCCRFAFSCSFHHSRGRTPHLPDVSSLHSNCKLQRPAAPPTRAPPSQNPTVMYIATDLRRGRPALVNRPPSSYAASSRVHQPRPAPSGTPPSGKGQALPSRHALLLPCRSRQHEPVRAGWHTVAEALEAQTRSVEMEGTAPPLPSPPLHPSCGWFQSSSGAAGAVARGVRPLEFRQPGWSARQSWTLLRQGKSSLARQLELLVMTL